MITSGMVQLYTNDIEAALAFYRDLLGLTETFRTPATGIPEHVELASVGFTLGLGTVEAAKRVSGIDADPGHPTMAVVLWTDDVDAVFAHARDAGAPVEQEPHDVGHDNRAALVRDPDGTLVELVAKIG